MAISAEFQYTIILFRPSMLISFAQYFQRRFNQLQLKFLLKIEGVEKNAHAKCIRVLLLTQNKVYDLSQDDVEDDSGIVADDSHAFSIR